MFQEVIDGVDVGMGLLISLVLGVEMGRGNYPTPNLMTSGPILLSTSHIEVGVGHLFATHVAMWLMRGGVRFLFPGFLECTDSLLFPVNRVSSTVPPR